MLIVSRDDRLTRRTGAEKQREYRERKGKNYRSSNAARMRAARTARLTEFVGVDGEGMGQGSHHRYVLLRAGTGDALENPGGIHWQEAFEYLYGAFQANPRAAYVGFFLGYDFTQILKTLPREPAWRLLTRAGRASRLPRDSTRHIRTYPVRQSNWEFDLLGFKRLDLRPRDPECACHMQQELPAQGPRIVRPPCPHMKYPWMSICDAGPFYQQAFIDVINPRQWVDDPDGPVCTEDEYELVEKGKRKRANAYLSDEMRLYNSLENELLARTMRRLDKGFRGIGINLRKNEWYGPGAAAQAWMRKEQIPKRTELKGIIPQWARDACQASYYGGWFEIFSHGLILKKSWNYDINSAYPYAIKSLPCLLHGEWRQKRGRYDGNGKYVLLHCTVRGSNSRIGPLPHRRDDGSILRPRVTRGWYWRNEIQAAQRANLVDSYTVDEWAEYEPCNCPPPAADIQELYDTRLAIGKNSAAGLAIKLPMNSWYGKAAQSVGKAPYGNWFYASWITASCRIQILDAIAAHPGGSDSVLMVATDGIAFDSRHPSLPISTKLGDWDEAEFEELTLFKPGVYWHKTGEKAVLKVKTRGVPKRHFVESVWMADAQFKDWHVYKDLRPWQVVYEGTERRTEARRLEIQTVQGWPYLYIPIDFSMTTCLQALMQEDWEKAGHVSSHVTARHDCDPHEKRAHARWNNKKRRMDSYVHELDPDHIESAPYKVRFTPEEDLEKFGVSPDGPVPFIVNTHYAALRGDREWDKDIAGDVEFTVIS